MSLNLAMDRTSDKQAQYAQGDQQLLAEIDAAIDGGLKAVAILDPASFASAWPQFGALASARGGGSLFAGTPQAQDPAVAPLLVPLQRADVGTHAALTRIARQSPAVVWLASDVEAKALAEMLAAKLHAELSDGGRPITLRYYDPRVLPELLRVLDLEQQRSLNDGVRIWWWLDRDNAVQRSDADTARPVNDEARPFGAAIALRDEQLHDLLDASFIDRVLDIVVRTSTDCLKSFDRAERFELSTRLIEAASRWCLTSEFDCANYIVVALQQGEAFAGHPAWADLMLQVKAGALRFTDAIENWEQRHADLA